MLFEKSGEPLRLVGLAVAELKKAEFEVLVGFGTHVGGGCRCKTRRRSAQEGASIHAPPYSTPKSPACISLLRPILVIMHLSRDRTALPAQAVLRFRSFAWREHAAIGAVADDRAVQPSLIPREPPCLGTGERAIRNAMAYARHLIDLAAPDGRRGGKRKAGGQRQTAKSNGQPTCDSFHRSFSLHTLSAVEFALPAGYASH